MVDWDTDERVALVALLRTRPEGLTWPQITAMVADVGSAMDVWDKFHAPDLFSPAGGDEEELRAARRDVESWLKEDFRFLTFKDADYPAQLRDVHQVPPVLFSRGALMQADRAISVVGSRNATNRGLGFARDVSVGLASRGLTVLSGLARGIDAAAHEAALDVGGRTVAVIGTGIRRYYPAENRALQDKIVDSGLVISQFWPDAPPGKHHFPMRNATMSAYGLATVVVEAGEHSGARIQARVAVAHGRPVILSDMVLETTKWGPALLGQPGVFRARSVDDALDFAEQAASATTDVSRLLDLIAQ
ncbi:DNA-processing protein DprA [Amycolatopsis sp. NPDC004378]